MFSPFVTDENISVRQNPPTNSIITATLKVHHPELTQGMSHQVFRPLCSRRTLVSCVTTTLLRRTRMLRNKKISPQFVCQDCLGLCLILSDLVLPRMTLTNVQKVFRQFCRLGCTRG